MQQEKATQISIPQIPFFSPRSPTPVCLLLPSSPPKTSFKMTFLSLKYAGGEYSPHDRGELLKYVAQPIIGVYNMRTEMILFPEIIKRGAGERERRERTPPHTLIFHDFTVHSSQSEQLLHTQLFSLTKRR